MKKYLPIITLLLVCICTAKVYAASGSIQVSLPQEAEATVYYAKVAEWEELDENLANEFLESKKEISWDGSLQANQEGEVKIENLPEGVYQLQVSGENGYEFSRALVSIPMWDEEQKIMNYHLTVIPKYTYHPPEIEVKNTPLDTGDASKTGIYVGIMGISLIIVAIMSCHNRFKCARMSE